MNDRIDFTGKVALVTGSSRGIGAEMIKAFGARGAKCVVNYFSDPQGQNKADAEAVAKELKEPSVDRCRRDETGASRRYDEANPGSTWWARHSDQQFRDHSRPDDQENVARRVREHRARESDRHIQRHPKSGTDFAKRWTSDQHVVRKRTDGTLRPGELFVEQGRQLLRLPKFQPASLRGKT